MGCGGILGVNLGSVEEPRLIKMSYRPDSPTGHLGLVGKGIMYDSGGISLKPSDESHAQMKNDMTGCGGDPRCDDRPAGRWGARRAVTAYLCCTDNMPSGSAMKLGDVLRMRNGTTVEVLNTDAEGRLVMADGLCLAVEDGVDAVVDIATLTGACLRTFGVDIAGVMGNDPGLVEQLRARRGRSPTSRVWELPLHRPYRAQLDSPIADMTNMGGVNAGLDHGGALPGGVRRRHPVGARRHRRHGAAAGGADLAQQGRQRVRRQAPRRAGDPLRARPGRERDERRGGREADESSGAASSAGSSGSATRSRTRRSSSWRSSSA